MNIKKLIFLFFLFVSFVLSSCKTKPVEKKDQVKMQPKENEMVNQENTRQYSRKEKLQKFDLMLSDLLSKIQKEKNLSPLLQVSDEYSRINLEEYWEFALKSDYSELTRHITHEEVIYLIKNGERRIDKDGSFIDYGMKRHKYEYGISFTFHRQPGHWILYDLVKRHPEE
ncbi:hypothetical protein EHQ12_10735 [Leptospira gomenensis]|uniref:Lipoprotein n=1 Tax=Leptospira gomenensis TaxID=2484974 RepID=A0A5F1YIB4_9LEPT|nr:hypothetical protein [Leptospira gomenensis]TGK34317.1 hypothetical protein EHQ17_09870 [Leptospira gomenensis]TGK38202.1 hypothetical protein EHQ12_10735 [Leptospira gomenensis]TGK41780.1 hypothetical protein EHQ07_15610 [Leptospira gomenensis]TGK55737.1 hypothetical protein EHQ13_16820 [Leptospira gomenensis]